MKTALLPAPGRLELRQVAPPEPGPGQVVVRVRAALTGRADYETYRRGHPRSLPFGREFAGEVASIGAGSTGLTAGQPVVGLGWAPCGKCALCRRDRENLCENPELASGAFGELVCVPATSLWPLPPELPFREAALLEAAACAVHALDIVPHREDETVLVLGCGTTGLLLVALARRYGAGGILVASHHFERLALARELGADHGLDLNRVELREAVPGLTAGVGVDLVVEASGQPSAWEASQWVVARGGAILLVAEPPAGLEVPFDTTRLHYDQITLQGATRFRLRDARAAYDLLAQGRLPTGRLLAGSCPLDDLPHLFARLEETPARKFAVLP